MSLEDLALLVRLLKKAIEADKTTHEYVKQSYHYFLEVYVDSDPGDKKVRDF